MIPLDVLPEYYMQRLVRRACSNAERVWLNCKGEELRILSIGEWNVHEGPDFLNVSISKEGVVFTGDAEVHKRSSDWFNHNHHIDSLYDRVVVHFVLRLDKVVDTIPNTIVFGEEDRSDISEPLSLSDQVLSLENLQDFAYARLMRKSGRASELCESRGISVALEWMYLDFSQRATQQRRRPNSQARIAKAEQTILSIHSSLRTTLVSDSCEIGNVLQSTFEHFVSSSGVSTATELMTNVILPTLFALLPDVGRDALLLWYWQLPASSVYGMLRRRFPYIPQDFVWQQQSMLEYYQTMRLRKERVYDLMIDYFADSTKTREPHVT